MPRSVVAVPREGRSRHEERVAARSVDNDRLAPRSRAESRPSTSRTGTESRSAVPGDARPERRTVTIRGRGSERYVPDRSSSRRRPERRYERSGFRPDRTAMWAVLLGVMLILAAAASAHAATLHAVAHLH